MPPSEQQIAEEIREAALQVNAAQDRVEERDFIAATHLAVETLSQHYRDFFEALDDGAKMKIERTLGRRMADIKRLASLLPRVGTIGSSTPDRAAGKSDVGERRITGVSWGAGTRAAGAGGTRLRVGGDVEAWCSACGGLTEHSIVAMVGDAPKQVVCQSCNGRHGYRTTPARKSMSELEASAGAGMGVRTTTSQERDAQRKADQKAADQRALAAEVGRATDVRDWDPKARYKAGEIIYHPEYGRGKIETVLRSSLLIRFSIGGLKSVILN
jgi:hypothetical protein